MEPPSDSLPGVKEAAKNYLSAKEIPQLFQVGPGSYQTIFRLSHGYWRLHGLDQLSV